MTAGVHDTTSRIAAVQRRTLAVVVAGQVLGGAGLAAGGTVGSLIARDMLGSQALSGLPVTASTAGGALATIGLSRLMSGRGRRPGLVAGYSLGAAGSLVVVLATSLQSFVLLCAGMAVFGSGNVASLLARYAGADLASPETRGRAISAVLFGTTFGAVAGPNLVGPAGELATAAGVPPLAGPFLISAAAYVLAAAMLAVLLRPDPLLLAREVVAAGLPDGATAAPEPGGSWAALGRGRALLALSAILVAQFVMIMMMTMTPVHMADHGHGITVIGFVISVHIAGMFLLSPLSGFLTDRIGRIPTLVAGAAVLVTAGVLGGLAHPEDPVLLTVALFLLGLGWSFSLVAGSTLLTESVPLDLRARAQGNADLLVGATGALASGGSGLILDVGGYLTIGLLTAGAALTMGLVAAGRVTTRAAAAPG